MLCFCKGFCQRRRALAFYEQCGFGIVQQVEVFVVQCPVGRSVSNFCQTFFCVPL